MTFDDFQKGALSTECAITEAVRQRFMECSLPLTAMMLGSDGLRFADEIKKYIFYGREMSEALLDEIEISADFYTPDEMFCNNPNNKTIRLVHAWLGIVSEIPELAEAIVKNDSVNIGEESGDVKFYCAILDDAAGFSSSRVAKANQKKLLTGNKARYRNGFSENAANSRDIVAESRILSEHLTD